ncbi:hypothetical protein [Mycobacterium palustre]|uniref:hypothetical protein n=1 Tax=Mycobacterium palustre TaxID=153971 RepID=UPI0013029576|nr:hypothetical protein [Mycobacterium palustre]MCV7099051.1 hypothetical protein [Mycobacterium palustre]
MLAAAIIILYAATFGRLARFETLDNSNRLQHNDGSVASAIRFDHLSNLPDREWSYELA